MWLWCLLVLAFAQSTPEKSVFATFGNKKNHYLHYDNNSSAALVILPGMSEPAKKYRSFIRDAKLVNFDIFIWDHRGHGDSDYEDGVTDPQKVYIKDYQSYIDPLGEFLKTLKQNYKSIHLIAHSMGAQIAMRITMEHPDIFAKVIYTAPMVEIMTGRVPRWLAQWALPLLFDKFAWCPGRTPYKESTVATSKVTTSALRIAEFHNLLMAEPQLIRGGCTMGWLMASMATIAKVQAYPGWSKVMTPTLMLHAEHERFVHNRDSARICKKLGDCKVILYPGSKHELLMERDEIRDQVIADIKKFLN